MDTLPATTQQKKIAINVDRNTQNHRWDAANKSAVEKSENLLAESNRLRNEAAKQASKIARQTSTQQANVKGQLERKVKELKSFRSRLVSWESQLQAARKRLMDFRIKGLDLCRKLDRPLNKSVTRLQLRAKRPQTENITDHVTVAIEQHATGAKNFMTELQQLCHNAEVLADQDSRHLAKLRQDITNKEQSIAIESQCLLPVPAEQQQTLVPSPPASTTEAGATTETMTDEPSPASTANNFNKTKESTNTNSPWQNFELNANKFQKSTKEPVIWKQASEFNMEKARQLTHDSRDLAAKIDAACTRMRDEHHQLSENVKAQLMKKAAQTGKHTDQLYEQVTKLEQEELDLNQQYDEVAAGVEAKNKPMEVLRQRIDARLTRPTMEKVRDEVELGLEKEFQLLVQGVEQMRQRQNQMEKEMKTIRTTRQKVKAAHLAKQQAFEIEKKCLELDGMSQYTLSSRGSSRPGSNRASSVRSARTGASSVAPFQPQQSSPSASIGTASIPRPPASARGSERPQSQGFLPKV